MTALLAGFAFGLVGSGHCAVMCGPLAMLPVARRSRMRYHGGRMCTYLTLGLLAGLLGASASMAGADRLLAIAAGAWLITLAGSRWTDAVRLPDTPTIAVAALLTRVGFPPAASRRSSWLFGMANGLLPCSLVYAAVVAAAGFGQLSAGLFFLAGFGAGTIPLLALGAATARAAAQWLPGNGRRATALALVAVGMLLIMRGAMPADLHIETSSRTVPHAHPPVIGD